MRSPKDMEIIQIDITNECVHRCSNCTRFCGHHKKPFYMDFETFKKAVDSLEGYTGIVGIIGGEPTIHPEFEKFAKYIAQKRLNKPVALAREPIKEILPYIQEHAFLPLDAGCKVGLWSSLHKGYYKHFETINDSFDYQALNDHDNTCMHQALLMSRKDCGLSDEEWIPQRDACWIQNTWSASITPKGAFFCEVAAALDMLFDGPGGWPIEKGWWKREPKDFADQLHWCELCSCGFDVPKRLSNDGRDDVTPTIYEKLKEIGSPKVQKGKVVIHTREEYQANKQSYKAFGYSTAYMDDNNSVRIHNNPNILPRKFDICAPSDFDELIKSSPKDWIVVSKNKKQANKIKNYLSNIIINPGCLYKVKNNLIFNVLASSIRDEIQNKTLRVEEILSKYPTDKVIDITTMIFPDRRKEIISKIFSVTNEYAGSRKYKVLTCMGIKLKKKVKSKPEVAEVYNK